jgi:hypothetical protein
MPTPEGAVKDRIKNLLAAFKVLSRTAILRLSPGDVVHGFYWMPVQGHMAEGGVADFVCCVNGRFIAIEAKRPKGGRQSALQAQFEETVNMSNGAYTICDGTPDSMDKLARVIGAAITPV